jgi:hypothetical protein
MKSLELDKEWSIREYMTTSKQQHWYDVYHTGCGDDDVSKPSLCLPKVQPHGQPRFNGRFNGLTDEMVCCRCDKEAPEAVVGMLILCEWRT